MCSHAKIGSQTVHPGSQMIIRGSFGSDVKTWGIGKYYNSRVENFNNFWKDFKHCYTEVSAFYEGNVLFTLRDQKLLKLAAIYNDEGISIITRPAVGIVKHVHHRMPVLLLMPDLFMQTGQIIEMDYTGLIYAA